MSDSEHPASTLVSAIERLQVLLRSLSMFYDQPRDAFALPPNFMMQSLGVAETCVSQAQDALERIMQHCDLTMLPAKVEQAADVVTPKPDAESDDHELTEVDSRNEYDSASRANLPIGYSESELEVAEAAIVDVYEPKHGLTQAAMTPKAGHNEQFAQTYLELLQKLTAAEIFATEQQALSPNQSQQQPLLPLLRSLRQDIQKLHNVA